MVVHHSLIFPRDGRYLYLPLTLPSLNYVMLTSFKEGSVRVQALVRLQAPTFLGQEGTKIEIYVTFRLRI